MTPIHLVLELLLMARVDVATRMAAHPLSRHGASARRQGPASLWEVPVHGCDARDPAASTASGGAPNREDRMPVTINRLDRIADFLPYLFVGEGKTPARDCKGGRVNDDVPPGVSFDTKCATKSPEARRGGLMVASQGELGCGERSPTPPKMPRSGGWPY